MVQRRQQLRHRLMLCVTNIFHSPVIIGRFLCSRSLDVIYILPTNTSGESVTFSGHPRWVGTDYGEFP